MQSLFEFLALNALLALGLALLLWPLCRLISAPWFANRAWLLILLKLITPPLIAIPLLTWQSSEDETSKSPLVIEEVQPSSILEAPAESPLEAIEIASTTVDASEPFPWEAWLIGTLLGGSCLWWLLIAWRIQRFRRTIDTLGVLEPASSELLQVAEEVARHLKIRRLPEIQMVAADWSPMLWVLGRKPRIFLPKRLWESLDADQRRVVLAHELAHYARKDHWVRRLELFVVGLYWWLPVVWFARQQLRRAEEACCDQLVVACFPNHASHYAEALVETAVYVSQPHLVPLASGGATSVRNLKRRLQMIFQPRHYSRSQKIAIVSSLLIGVLCLPLGIVFAQDKPVEKKSENKDKPKPTPDPNAPQKPKPPVDPNAPIKTKPESKPEKVESKLEKVEIKPSNPVSGAQLQELKDEIELLQVQLKSKITAVAAADRNFQIAREILDNTQKLEKNGSISRAEVLQVAKEYSKAQSDLDLRKAEVAEHEVRLMQLMRKLEALSKQGTKPTEAPIKTTKPNPNDPFKTTKPNPNDPNPKPTTNNDPNSKPKPTVTDPVKNPKPEVEAQLLAERDALMKQLLASEKAVADIAGMAAKMEQEMKNLQLQMQKTHQQMAELQAKQAEVAKARQAIQQQIEVISVRIQKSKPDNPK
jgi:beta-lactamase regulating signal transducer with metallopeptidase domain